MSVQLNHTIVRVRDKHEAAEFFAGILGLPPAIPYGPFLVLNTANGVSLDFADDHGVPVPTHYAFLVTEDEFGEILARIRSRGLEYWADPSHRRPGEINTNDGGRGLYWDDANGHALKIITRPYGSAT
jgi:catechol 2,3-dioxygenase-like lactoylglutathione lyase family enzyme